jgi:hypothetical protein
MNGEEYPVPLFYLFLKLDLWQRGRVSRWGEVEKVNVNEDGSTDKGFTVSRTFREQKSLSLIKKPLSPGLSLVGLYIQEESRKGNGFIYLAAISVDDPFRNTSKIVLLKISNQTSRHDFRDIVLDPYAQMPKRSKKPASLYRPKTQQIDTSPVNSYRRKY